MPRQVLLLAGAAAALALALGGALAVRALGRVGLSQGYAPEQPIAFSHRLHAGQYEVPCQYCHFAAERSRHAGIPPVAVCMGCHAQVRVASAEVQKLREAVAQRRPVRWVRIHELPDFVYFSHSRHVTAGLACQRCHGPVEAMDRVRQEAPLTMGWCIDCHRAEGVFPPGQGGLRAAEQRAGTRRVTGGLDCAKCHY